MSMEQKKTVARFFVSKIKHHYDDDINLYFPEIFRKLDTFNLYR